MSVLYSLELLARGGGGGSGGGGGGGGDGGGGILALFFGVGYVPVSWVVSKARKYDHAWVGVIAAIPVAFIMTILVAIIFKSWSILTFIGGISGFFGDKLGLNKFLNKQVKAAAGQLKVAASKDAAWNEERLKQVVQNTFQAYQADWSNFNLKRMQSYLTPEYFTHMQLVLTAMHAMGRRNSVESPKLLSAQFIDVKDEADNIQDNFTVQVQGQAHDRLLDETNQQELYVDDRPFTEYWQFRRHGNSWLLSSISQSTMAVDRFSAPLARFATDNHFFYNVDFGWLLLPKRGQLFSTADFTNSDVNNHVIGLYHKVIVEFYSYLPVKKQTEYYVIAQAVLPKTYGNIVVRQNKGRWQRKISGLNAISMEAREFNDKYQVFADNVEQVTSFELLNPSFMVKLIELPYEVNIEVVDNILYLYATDQNVSYESMMQILKYAFDELKL